MRTVRTLVVALVALGVGACGDTVINNLPPAPDPTPPPPVVTRTTIEFRAVGNATSARIRYATPSDGLTQVVSSLPYTSAFTTTATTLFLSLEVTPLTYPTLLTNPFLSIQIVVNGERFREATANDVTLNTLSVSGTWRQ